MTEGVEAWDCVLGETILLVLWILGFQGDNPMASEIASHIGMSGKFFCRVCHASTETGVPKSAPEDQQDAGEKTRLQAFMKVRYHAMR